MGFSISKRINDGIVSNRNVMPYYSISKEDNNRATRPKLKSHNCLYGVLFNPNLFGDIIFLFSKEANNKKLIVLFNKRFFFLN
jgi:hypothetical protein